MPQDAAQGYVQQLAQGEVLVLARPQGGTREAQPGYLLSEASFEDVES